MPIFANPLEAVATALGVANIVLLVRRSIWNYPFGLAMVALYARIFFDARLYSDAILQLFFFAIQLYGWWSWWRAGGVRHAVAVERLTNPARVAWVVMIAAVAALWGSIMRAYTDAAFPWWDAAIAVASIAAQVLLARRRIENWVLWILIDVAAIGLYFAKALYLTAGLYGLFLLLSITGLRQWNAARGRESA
ncbi:nicotinamide riboside transporter PnuC [uncultured Sphingomonas sp.]|uniref:nicotinamide riboside transporter PnuC n=1 Tax=uncultured Sphingomonas sp. TaxID=158754 RepID=UPI0025E25194|nr:nicotinamide riboside transporter PnuC [uncultured Sphingomonas sp.]